MHFFFFFLFCVFIYHTVPLYSQIYLNKTPQPPKFKQLYHPLGRWSTPARPVCCPLSFNSQRRHQPKHLGCSFQPITNGMASSTGLPVRPSKPTQAFLVLLFSHPKERSSAMLHGQSMARQQLKREEEGGLPLQNWVSVFKAWSYLWVDARYSYVPQNRFRYGTLWEFPGSKPRLPNI